MYAKARRSVVAAPTFPKGTVITADDAHGEASGLRREAEVHRTARRPDRAHDIEDDDVVTWDMV